MNFPTFSSAKPTFTEFILQNFASALSVFQFNGFVGIG